MDNQRAPRNYSSGTVKRDNRQQQQKLVVILICAVIALLLVVFMTIISAKIVLALTGGINNANPNDVKYKDISIDSTQTLYGPLALVNSDHEYQFPSKAGESLVNIWDYRTTHTAEGANPAYKVSFNTLVIDGKALPSIHQWLSDFSKATGKNDVMISSSYRTFEDQQKYSVPAGQSDHHTGFGITLKIYSDSVTLPVYDNPDYYTWLKDNAHKYGLVVRYPEGKEEITGISNYIEYFHYVGYGPAQYMHQNGLSLEEFVAQIKSYSVDNALHIEDANGKEWLIYYAACPGDMATIKVPSNFAYTMSGDNDGGVIICVSLSKDDVQQVEQTETSAQ